MSQNSFPENVPDAKQGEAVSVAAPGSVGVRGTNKAAWLSISNFLATQNLRQVLKARAQAAAARGPACGDASAAGEARTLPVGNHGEIVAMGVSL